MGERKNDSKGNEDIGGEQAGYKLKYSKKWVSPHKVLACTKYLCSVMLLALNSPLCRPAFIQPLDPPLPDTPIIS